MPKFHIVSNHLSFDEALMLLIEQAEKVGAQEMWTSLVWAAEAWKPKALAEARKQEEASAVAPRLP